MSLSVEPAVCACQDGVILSTRPITCDDATHDVGTQKASGTWQPDPGKAYSRGVGCRESRVLKNFRFGLQCYLCGDGGSSRPSFWLRRAGPRLTMPATSLIITLLGRLVSPHAWPPDTQPLIPTALRTRLELDLEP